MDQSDSLRQRKLIAVVLNLMGGRDSRLLRRMPPSTGETRVAVVTAFEQYGLVADGGILVIGHAAFAVQITLAGLTAGATEMPGMVGAGTRREATPSVVFAPEFRLSAFGLRPARFRLSGFGRIACVDRRRDCGIDRGDDLTRGVGSHRTYVRSAALDVAGVWFDGLYCLAARFGGLNPRLAARILAFN